MTDKLNFTTSLLGTFLGRFRGINTTAGSTKPALPLELYDIEGCPYCRLVRETLTQLDLDVVIYPCPKNGTRFRSVLREQGLKEQFPYLVDPNTNEKLYESADIIHYLYQHYSDDKAPSTPYLKAVRLPSAMSVSAIRLTKGMNAAPSTLPKELLELYSFEGSPYARFVRERLCELEIPYLCRSTGRTNWQDHVPPPFREKVVGEYHPTNSNRQALMERVGEVTIPFLVDDNTETAMGNSDDILEYLENTYAASSDRSAVA